MSDPILMKRMGGDVWLGLRMPSGLRILTDSENRVVIPPGWKYTETKWPTNLQAVYLPSMVHDAASGSIDKKWTPLPLAGDIPIPFTVFENTIAAWTLEDRTSLSGNDPNPDEALRQKFSRLREDPKTPLWLMEIYREMGSLAFDTKPSEPGFIDRTQRRLFDLASSNDVFPIEMLSGLLFFAVLNANTEPVVVDETQSLSLDSTAASIFQPKTLAIRAVQFAERVALQLSLQTSILTNKTVIDAINAEGKVISSGALANPEADAGAPTFRLSRTLGIEQRPSLKTGHIRLQTTRLDESLPKDLSGELKEPLTGNFRGWAERHFLPSDSIGNDLVGELLNYQLSLFNAHGRCTHQGRLMVARQSLERPAPPTRGVARLIVNAVGAPKKMEIWLGVPNSEIKPIAKDAVPELKRGVGVIVYRHDSALIPTGFYGDADDAALATARMMSDLDPAALLASGVADFPSDDSQGDPDPALASYGLEALPQGVLNHYKTGRPSPDPSRWIHSAPVDKESEQSENENTEQSDEEKTKQSERLHWWMRIDNVKELVRDGLGLRLYVALQREVDSTMLQPRQRAPESRLVSLGLEIVVQPDEDSSAGLIADTTTHEDEVLKRALEQLETTVATVQHFERFWVDGLEKLPSALGDGLARVVEVLDETSAAPAPAPAILDVVVDHAKVTNKDANARMLVGGYRMWVRDLAVPGAQFHMEAVVQALPPLVKAYAPIEAGRQWTAEIRDPAPALGPSEVALPKEVGFAGAVIKEGAKPEKLDTLIKQANDAVKRPGAGAVLLLLMRSLALAGQAQEVLLSVGQLSERNYGGAMPDGNWLFMRDQNGRFLGRAWKFWGIDETFKTLSRCYVLTEEPNAQDTVGMDDFGRIHWLWKGLKDTWRHELEWAIEPLARHAPLLQRIKVGLDTELQATELGNDLKTQMEVVDRYRKGDLQKVEKPLKKDGKTVLKSPTKKVTPVFSEESLHRIVVQRRKPMETDIKFGVVQKINSKEDRFVFSVFAPPSFRESTYNSMSRTAQGVLTMEMKALKSKFLWADKFLAGLPISLIDAWCTRPSVVDDELAVDSTPAAAIAPSFNTSDPLTGEFGELVIDEPSCISIQFELQMRADDVQGGETKVVGVSRAAPPPQDAGSFENGKPLMRDRPFLDNELKLQIPLARLSWSYTGGSQPLLAIVPDWPEAWRNKSLLRLPDPFAEAMVYARTATAEPFQLAARFRGQGLTNLDATAMLPMTEVACHWGYLWVAPNIFASLVVDPLAQGTGTVVVSLNAGYPSIKQANLRLVWKLGDYQLMLTPFKP